MTQQAPIQGDKEFGLAKEWIASLQRRNAVLTLVWPILLVVSVVFGALSFYWYQALQMEMTQTRADTAANQQLVAQIDQLSAEKDAAELARSNLADELAALKESILSEQGLLDQQSTLNQQLIETLKARIIALEEEGRDFASALVDKEAALKTAQSEKKPLQQKLNVISQRDGSLNKQLASRKTAFDALMARQKETRAEVDRLAALVNERERALAAAQQAAQEAQKERLAQAEEMQATRDQLEQLEMRLQALISPISVTAPPATPATQTNGASGDTAIPPATGNTAPTEAPRFDYDSIAIDRP